MGVSDVPYGDRDGSRVSVRDGFQEGEAVSKGARVLVCGGRNKNPADIWNWLERFLRDEIESNLGHSMWPISALMHGGAKGADEGAGQWAESEGIEPLVFKANWKSHGRSAGPRRNSIMLREGRPDIVIAFPGGAGTKNMVEQARGLVPVIEVKP
jgi:hypothetical protein